MAAYAHVRDLIGADVNSHFHQFVTELDRNRKSGDQKGLYQYIKGTVGMCGTRLKEEQYIWDKDGVLLWDKEESGSRWVRVFNTLLNTNSPEFDPTIIG